MRRFSMLTIALLGVLLISAGAVSAGPENFRAHLSGGEEVPPVDTNAQGQAIFQLSKDGTELKFQLIVANIENVVASHIHCGAVGVNGPVGVTLFGMVPPAGGRVNGILAQGNITAPDPGTPCGWTDLDDVMAAIQSGNTYVNVHTNDGVHPGNSGPGDFQSGEIRGQVR